MPLQAAPATTRTVTIVDGKTGARQEVIIPATGSWPAVNGTPFICFREFGQLCKPLTV